MLNSIEVSFVTKEIGNQENAHQDFSEATDNLLLDYAKRLDSDALSEIHDRYYKLIYSYVASKVGAGQMAEDYASDVFVRLLHAIRQKSAPRDSLKGWLYRVASNIINDHYRKHYRRSYSGLTEVEPSREKSPEELTQIEFTNATLNRALGQLKEEQQKVISLRFAFEMSVSEVASIIGKSETAIRQIQFRGIRKLAEIMAGEN